MTNDQKQKIIEKLIKLIKILMIIICIEVIIFSMILTLKTYGNTDTSETTYETTTTNFILKKGD